MSPSAVHVEDGLTVGDVIAAARHARGMKQSELARRAGLTPSAVSRAESGARDPERTTLLAIVNALEMNPQAADMLLGMAGYQDRETRASIEVERIAALADSLASLKEAERAIAMAISETERLLGHRS